MGVHRRPAPLGEQQIGEAKQREELRLVFRQSAIAGLAMPEQVLDHLKRMFDLRPDARLELLEPVLQRKRPAKSSSQSLVIP